VYWPDLIANDPEFREYSIYLGGYFTGLNARELSTAECANNLFAALGRREGEHKPVLDHESIIFVCHSTGGVVVRYMLTEHARHFAAKRVGLVLIASPSYGSSWASMKLLRYVAALFRHEVAKELEWASPILRDLDGRFRALIDEVSIPYLDGAEACENHFLFRLKFLPPLPLLVTRESAGRYFGRVRILEDTDHSTAVKPNDRTHPVYSFLRDFRARFEKKFLRGSRSFGLSDVKHTPLGLYACREIQWDSDIDQDGDARNEMSFSGIVLLDQQKENFMELPRAEVQSGQLVLYSIVPGGRTSQGIVADPSPQGARSLTMRLKFANRPTAGHPASFCLMNWDLNAFSMDTEESKTKPNFRADGIDFAEKYIEEQIDFFTLTVRLPVEMKLAREPFVEVYSYEGGEARLHDGLTSALQPYFHYSSLLRTAMLRVPNPPASYSYRISWQLTGPALLPPARDNELLQFRVLTFSEHMLGARTYLIHGTGTSEISKLAEFIAVVLTSFGDKVKELIMDILGPQAALDPNALSISLMMLEPATNELVIVAGNIDDRNFRLGIGDGNGGRAWKRHTARVYDKSVADPKHNVYFPHPVRPPHEILFSLPLFEPLSKSTIHGILNVGTYQEAQAHLLRALKGRDSIEQLGSIAQSYVIQRLLSLIFPP
jgi:hypothetical protein